MGANNSAYVTTGKPKVGGAAYKAPLNTQLPSDATTALANTFINQGYISEDGLTNTIAIDSETIKAWGGGVVDTMETGKEDSFKFTLIESINPDVQKTVHGESDVTGTPDGTTGMKVSVGTAQHEAFVWAFDMVLKGGILKRVVIPKGRVREIGEITYKDNEAVGYEITLSCELDSSGYSHYEYFKTPTASGGST